MPMSMSSCSCLCLGPTMMSSNLIIPISGRPQNGRSFRVKASNNKSELGSSSDSFNFASRIEQAWLISQQPTPVACTSCNTDGCVECKWCSGTGFLILGDNMLCEVPSRNTTCIICAGEGSMRCTSCQGTGFRAKWLEKPPIYKD